MAELSNKRRDLGFVTARRQIRYAEETWGEGRRVVDGSSARAARVAEDLSSRGSPATAHIKLFASQCREIASPFGALSSATTFRDIGNLLIHFAE